MSGMSWTRVLVNAGGRCVDQTQPEGSASGGHWAANCCRQSHYQLRRHGDLSGACRLPALTAIPATVTQDSPKLAWSGHELGCRYA